MCDRILNSLFIVIYILRRVFRLLLQLFFCLRPLQKNVNQIEILKIEILYNILDPAAHFIKLVVGEKHFELECQRL